jgi:ubiquinone/menaquinone biosynthesis C-methylase UbiE
MSTQTQAHDAQRYYDDFSSHYDHGRDRGYHALIDELELSIVEPYARGKRVLEAGCGTGLILSRLDRVAKSAVGVDLSPGMLKHARARGLNVVHGSVTALPFADASFDTVCSFKVLAHVPDIDAALRELARVTRPGGHLVLEFYNRFSLRYLARIAAGARSIGRAHHESDIPTRWDTPREILERMPRELSPIAVRGVRVVTPAAAVHRVRGASAIVAAAERLAVRSPLRWLGGFLVVVLERV